MATEYKKIRRYDEARAKSGVRFTPADEWEQTYGTWTISLYDTTSPFVAAAIENLERTKAETLRNLKDSERETFYFAQLFVHDWEGVLDKDDKPVKFSHDEAFQYLRGEAWLANVLRLFARNVRNFGDDPRVAKEEVSGN